MRTIIILSFLFLLTLCSWSQNKPKKPYYNQQIAKGLIKLDKSYFHYKSIKQNEVKTSIIHFFNNSDDTLELFFKNIPNYISINIEPQISKPQENGTITVVYDASKNIDKNGEIRWGKDYKRIPVFIKGKENQRNARTDFVTLRTFIEEDFSYLSKRELKTAPVIKFDTIVYNFGKIEQGTVVIHDFVFENLGKRDLKIRYAKGC